MKVVAHTRSYKALSCLWDGGADISLITNSKARQLNLKGKPIKLYVTTAGGHKSVVDSMAYVLVLRDKMGYTHSLRVYGIDKITSDVAKFELNSIVKQFENISLQDIEVVQRSRFANWVRLRWLASDSRTSKRTFNNTQ